ncbi:hypothetical protein D3C81_1595930 [compost metagenome]
MSPTRPCRFSPPVLWPSRAWRSAQDWKNPPATGLSSRLRQHQQGQTPPREPPPYRPDTASPRQRVRTVQRGSLPVARRPRPMARTWPGCGSTRSADNPPPTNAGTWAGPSDRFRRTPTKVALTSFCLFSIKDRRIMADSSTIRKGFPPATVRPKT